MAAFVSPNMVIDGLTLYLDAANPKSYPGTGTSWFDLSGNGNDATLFGSTTYDSVNKAIDLGSSTNITNYISAPKVTLDGLTAWTMELIIERNASNSLEPFVSLSANNAGLLMLFPAPTLSFWNTTTSGGFSGSYDTTIGTPFHLVVTGTGSTITAYQNNVFEGTQTNSSTLAVASNIGVILGQELDNDSTGGFAATQAFLGKYYVVRFYNRVLTATERTTNYIAFKDRFKV